MITGAQIVAHLVGDYMLQSQWMADNKTKRTWPCICHVVAYSAPFLFLRPSWPALLFIVSTHFLIDRFRLARFINWAKNHMAPFARFNLDPHNRKTYFTWTTWRPFAPWKECQTTGYHDQALQTQPPWMRVWLLIITDNILHILLNGFALTFM